VGSDRLVNVELGLLIRFKQITNRHSAIDNRETHPPPRGGTDLIVTEARFPKLRQNKAYRTQRFTIHDLPFTITEKGHP
jgi:hypothetical protein